jgi:hypothetical protein
MNLFVSIIIGFVLLYASCSYTTVPCTVEYNGSKIVVYRKPIAYEKTQIMYQHNIQYCGIKEEIYSVQNETINQLLAAEPEKIVYSTIWGMYSTMEPIYVTHTIAGIFFVMIMTIINNEMQDKRYYK